MGILTAFLKLPAANIQTLFSRLQELSVKAGDEIVKFGAPGDYYYIIKQGRCKVFRPVGSGEHTLAELGPCDSFGEEALISEAPRNATVTMLTDGKLMRLSKRDFVELLAYDDLLVTVSPCPTGDQEDLTGFDGFTCYPVKIAIYEGEDGPLETAPDPLSSRGP